MSCRRSLACVLLVVAACRPAARPPPPQPTPVAKKDAGADRGASTAADEGTLEHPLPTKIETSVVHVDKSIGTPELVADATALYWIAPNGIRRLPKAGGSSELIMSGGGKVTALAASSAYVVWATDDPVEPGHGSVFRRDAKNGTVRRLATDIPTPTAIAVDDTFAYFTAAAVRDPPEPASIRRVRFGGEDLETIARGTDGALRLVLDRRFIYTLSSKTPEAADIVRIPKSGGAPMVISAAQPSVLGLAVDDRDVTFTIAGPREAQRPAICKKPPCPAATAAMVARNGEIRRVPKTGGATTTILGKLDEVGGVDVDAVSILYRQHGELFVLPKAGGSPRPALESSSLPANLHVEAAQYIAHEGKVYVIAQRPP